MPVFAVQLVKCIINISVTLAVLHGHEVTGTHSENTKTSTAGFKGRGAVPTGTAQVALCPNSEPAINRRRRSRLTQP